MARSCPRVGRRGISLLEVLISMFVLLVGLAGIASLLPAGRSEIMQGVKLDYAMMVGRNALREIEARSYLSPGTPATDATRNLSYWFDANGVRMWDLGAWAGGKWSKADAPFNVSGGTNRVAVAFDPLSIYANAVYGQTFPNTGGVAALTRISPLYQKNVAAGVTTTQAHTDANGRLLAEGIFMCQDDLILRDNQAVKKDPPIQMMSSDKRSWNGNYTWLATLVSAPADSGLTSPMTLSVAVFYKRDLSSDGAGEHAVSATIPTPWSNEITVNLANATPSSPALKPLKPGQWFMLAGRLNGGTVAYWYRVIAAGAPDGTNQTLTLHGPDWNTAATNAQAFILDNVIAVYEKSVELQFQ
jgi:hypothetical protein